MRRLTVTTASILALGVSSAVPGQAAPRPEVSAQSADRAAPDREEGRTLQQMLATEGAVQNAPRNLSLRSGGVSRVSFVKGQMNGISVNAPIPAADEAVLSYQVRVPEDTYEGIYSRVGGKMPGLAGVPDDETLWYASSGGKLKRDSWSVRLHPRQSSLNGVGRPWWDAYVYAPRADGRRHQRWGIQVPLTDGLNGEGEHLRMPVDRWFEVRMRVELNTPGKDDGELDIWIDGVQGVKLRDVRWRDAGVTTPINTFMGNTFVQPRAPENGYVDFREFRIGPATGSGSATEGDGKKDAGRSRSTATTSARESAGSPFGAGRAWVDPNSKAARAAAAATDPQEEEALRRLAAEGSAVWIGDWTEDVATTTADVVRRAESKRQTPVFAAFAIPDRDCSGGHSAGGAADAAAYREWIDSLAEGVRGSGAVVILEPDALADLDCLSAAGRAERARLLAEAGKELTAAGATVYLDAGFPGGQSAQEMAKRLKAAGVKGVRGFSLNVSNYSSTAASTAYGREIRKELGGSGHFVIDTSRNGAGPVSSEDEEASCNPPGRRIGDGFTTETGDPAVDAWLWVKPPGESDGACNGGPAAGKWWQERAVQLAGD
ncbi:glycosyl hydrolase family 6 [Kineococcus xinjiangensis]|uniref:Glucanase n=1 Tax=Kineococcus xinjiangensis TaxID=512762 RepID=A0A2S6IV61_9ACTN|nr:glycoside hydrolase family 6 protein [Kineococcus xinjiangensis]PPK98098.1 glycosyl hydrolase family 6 [Kineococcus xinjiangensis]